MKDTIQLTSSAPSDDLALFIESFWMIENPSDKDEELSTFPDGGIDLYFFHSAQYPLHVSLVGLETGASMGSMPSHSRLLGVRLKILASEFLLNREVASLLQNKLQLDLKYLNIDTFDLSSFETIVAQWQKELLAIKPVKTIQGNKLRLSQLLDKMNGNITATEASNQIYWTNRQINRYLNKYVGVSLKKYLLIQKCYQSYLQIRKGDFYPDKGFYDQPHFIREIKKHTGETPKSLHEQQNDRFIQLKRISEE